MYNNPPGLHAISILFLLHSSHPAITFGSSDVPKIIIRHLSKSASSEGVRPMPFCNKKIRELKIGKAKWINRKANVPSLIWYCQFFYVRLWDRDLQFSISFSFFSIALSLFRLTKIQLKKMMMMKMKKKRVIPKPRTKIAFDWIRKIEAECWSKSSETVSDEAK